MLKTSPAAHFDQGAASFAENYNNDNNKPKASSLCGTSDLEHTHPVKY